MVYLILTAEYKLPVKILLFLHRMVIDGDVCNGYRVLQN